MLDRSGIKRCTYLAEGIYGRAKLYSSDLVLRANDSFYIRSSRTSSLHAFSYYKSCFSSKQAVFKRFACFLKSYLANNINLFPGKCISLGT